MLRSFPPSALAFSALALALSAAEPREFDLSSLAPAADGALRWSTPLPEGNYRVTVALGSPTEAGRTAVLAEARRLFFEPVATAPGETVTRSFLVHLRTPPLPPREKFAPGGDRVALNERELGSPTWDDRLSLEFAGPAPRVRSVRIEPTDAPALFLLGDSTVTDQRLAPAGSWGQMLPRFLRDTIVVANHAESGETLKSFQTSLRLAKVLSLLRAGDWVVLQFGHNDQKKQWPQTYADAATTYPAYLRAYLAEVRLRGAHAVLVTSPERRAFDAAGKIKPSHGDYPDAVCRVAAEENVPVIDLHAESIRFYEALGPQRAPLAFADNGRDPTHHNTYGAYVLAACVANGLRAVPELAPHVAADVKPLAPAHPPAPEEFFLPTRTDEKR